MLNHLHGKPETTHTAGSMQGWGKTYDRIVSLLTLGQEEKLRQASLKEAHIRLGEHILEVGCGTGSLTLRAKANAGRQSQVYGIDIAPDMLETARMKAQKAGLEVRFELGRIEQIPFPEGQFDLVLSSLMLHHIQGNEAKQQGIKEIFRVLKPGGRVLIVDFAPPANPVLRWLVSGIVGHAMIEKSVMEFAPMLETAGFANIKTGLTTSRFLAFLSGTRPL